MIRSLLLLLLLCVCVGCNIDATRTLVQEVDKKVTAELGALKSDVEKIKAEKALKKFGSPNLYIKVGDKKLRLVADTDKEDMTVQDIANALRDAGRELDCQPSYPPGQSFAPQQAVPREHLPSCAYPDPPPPMK